jgi:hypothetical protein
VEGGEERQGRPGVGRCSGDRGQAAGDRVKGRSLHFSASCRVWESLCVLWGRPGSQPTLELCNFEKVTHCL